MVCEFEVCGVRFETCGVCFFSHPVSLSQDNDRNIIRGGQILSCFLYSTSMASPRFVSSLLLLFVEGEELRLMQ